MGPPMTFNSGDGYEIYKLLVALDQPGRGKGDLLADGNPVATGVWPRQALEPVYAWGNNYNNSRNWMSQARIRRSRRIATFTTKKLRLTEP